MLTHAVKKLHNPERNGSRGSTSAGFTTTSAHKHIIFKARGAFIALLASMFGAPGVAKVNAMQYFLPYACGHARTSERDRRVHPVALSAGNLLHGLGPRATLNKQARMKAPGLDVCTNATHAHLLQ